LLKFIIVTRNILSEYPDLRNKTRFINVTSATLELT